MKKERKIITIPKTQIQRVWKNGKVLIWKAFISSLLIFWPIEIPRNYFDNILLKCFLELLAFNLILNGIICYIGVVLNLKIE